MSAKPKSNNEICMINDPKSSFSEAIRSIKTNLEFSSVDKDIKTILITSPEPGDGKSFISANLALAYTLDDKKVLIIDCDLRRGRQNKIFGLNKKNDKGYSNLILDYNKEKTDLKKYIEKTEFRNLNLLQNGATPPNPIELLSSEKNKNLLNDLKAKYDVIILDCPPVLGLSDTLVLTKFSDANIVTVSSKKTKLETLKEVNKHIEKANSKITGIIINKTKRKKSSYYGYGYY